MKRHLLYIAISVIAAISPSCSSEETGETVEPSNDTELTVTGLSDDQWTYISLRKNTIVGHSAVDDPESDAAWAERTDWDLAVCGDLIRTNSGTSGRGNGGLRRIDGIQYDEISEKDAVTDADRPSAPSSPRE